MQEPESETPDSPTPEATITEAFARAIDHYWPHVVTGLDSAKELELRGKLATKIARCYVLAEPIGKEGFNQHFKFKFASADAIYQSARTAMAEVGIVVLPIMGSYTEVCTDPEKGTNYMVQQYTFCVMDGETGYTIPIPWTAEVLETGDKGLGKLTTYATKTFLKALFYLPVTDTDDDPDNGSEQRGAAKPNPKPAAPRPAPKPNPKFQGSAEGGANPPTQVSPNHDVTPAEKKRREELRKVLEKAYPGLKEDQASEKYHAARDSVEALRAVCKRTGYAFMDLVLLAASSGMSTAAELLIAAANPDHPLPKSPQPASEADLTTDRRVEDLTKEFMLYSEADAIVARLDVKGLDLAEIIRESFKKGKITLESLLGEIDLVLNPPTMEPAGE